MNETNQINLKNQKKYVLDPIKESKKYCHLLDFYDILPNLRKDISYALKNFDYSKNHIIYLILAIIDLCNFRIGNEKYKKSTGIATLKTKNISECSNNQKNNKCSYIRFNGKRQVLNECEILNEKINMILMELVEYNEDNDLDFVFTYISNGIVHKITADDVNDFLKNYGNISTKMFRTWKANYYFLKYIRYLEIPNNKTNMNKNISYVVGKTAEKLHHSKNICRRSYLDSRIINLYRDNPVEFLEFLEEIPKEKNKYLLENENNLKYVIEFLCNSN